MSFETFRRNQIKTWIKNRVKKNETGICVFEILLLKKESRDVLESLLKRNEYQNCHVVDTVTGCWNLDDEWYELTDIEAIGEYCGVYPVKWDIDDVVLLEELYNNKDIYINVVWKQKNEDGTVDYVPNH